ncbi:hypothetical protein BJV74DRAFT_787731 [Russula compacta]|nr:hypothetical protein BJV74DRAFT_787731 [Russula compacta]
MCSCVTNSPHLACPFHGCKQYFHNVSGLRKHTHAYHSITDTSDPPSGDQVPALPPLYNEHHSPSGCDNSMSPTTDLSFGSRPALHLVEGEFHSHPSSPHPGNYNETPSTLAPFLLDFLPPPPLSSSSLFSYDPEFEP